MTDLLKTGFYHDVFKVWQPKFMGAKPTVDQLTTVSRLGARHGKQCLAIAMALRDTGTTGSQIVMACGAPQLNKMRGFIADGLLKRVATAPVSTNGGNPHQVYKLEVTAKGVKRIEGAAKREADLEAKGEAEQPRQATGKAKGAAKAKGGTKRAPKAETAQAATVAAHVEQAPAATVTDHPLLPSNEPFSGEATA